MRAKRMTSPTATPADVPLPPELLNAVASGSSGSLVLVIGAGCSVECPTQLPLSRKWSEETHRRLLADGVLSEGDCESPHDLSCLAESVHARVAHLSLLPCS